MPPGCPQPVCPGVGQYPAARNSASCDGLNDDATLSISGFLILNANVTLSIMLCGRVCFVRWAGRLRLHRSPLEWLPACERGAPSSMGRNGRCAKTWQHALAKDLSDRCRLAHEHRVGMRHRCSRFRIVGKPLFDVRGGQKITEILAIVRAGNDELGRQEKLRGHPIDGTIDRGLSQPALPRFGIISPSAHKSPPETPPRGL